MTVLGAHPDRLDLTVHPGDTIGFAVPILDETGATVPLAGWSCAATATAPDGTVLHDFAPTIVSDAIRVAATSAETAAWRWALYAARLTVTATPPSDSPAEILVGWIRLYRP